MDVSDYHAVLGYQMRVLRNEVLELWTPEHRQKYLLVPNIDVPLSADGEVWPIASCVRLGEELFEDFVSGEYEAPNGLNVFQLSRDFLLEKFSIRERTNLVGIAVRSDTATRLRKKYFIFDPTMTKSPLGMGAQLIGFDVCDEVMTSGLMNCGLTSSDRENLISIYAPSINRYGLFDNIEVAEQFAGHIGKLVPEHAPFIPVGLFLFGELS